MAHGSSIEWTESTWNPLTGCNKVSAGCKYCYAERFSKRLKAMGVPSYMNGFKLTLHPEVLEAPLSWKKPQMIFVNSMSDLFHEKVPIAFIQKVFDVMTRANQHTFQILTKRSERLRLLNSEISWPDNVWMGVSVENEKVIHRIDDLRQTNARIKFLSLEPLLGPLSNLNLKDIDWAIAGGESGPGSRPMEPDWVRGIRDQCNNQNVPFFFKQWGGIFKKKNGRLLDGKYWDQMPESFASKSITNNGIARKKTANKKQVVINS